MDIRQHPLWAGFPIGRWFDTTVRVSILFPLAILILLVQLGVTLGLMVSLILFASILIHEFAHVFAARQGGGEGNEILIWPLGGLAFVQSAGNLRAELWTIAAGPLSNLAICLATGYWVWEANFPYACFHPVEVPGFRAGSEALPSLALLAFSINFKLLILNLLPIYPLDGGQMMFQLAKEHWDRQTAKIGTLLVGIILAILVVVGGHLAKLPTIMLLGMVLFSFASYEHLMAQMMQQLDDSFLGYDFSQGYTSLEGKSEPAPPKPSVFQRWKQEREARKRELETQQRLEAERRLDLLLQQIAERGMDSLTDEERRFLQQTSSRYRTPGQ